MTGAAIPLALYAHFPWCVQKCPYCDFNSHKMPDELPEQRYVDALLQDLELDVQQHFASSSKPSIVSIFMGGGTPSLFSPAVIARFIDGARARLQFNADIEITLEANPGTIEHGRFVEYRSAGVNRVSLGAQSFAPEQLRKLGRIHGSEDIPRAVEELHRAGLSNFNLDLMYGLPNQSLSEALNDLEQAIALRPAHLSHYQLTLEPGTAFYHQPPPLPDDERCYQMQQECQALLAAADFVQYEVSAYARLAQSVHNRNYWEFGDYLGVGAGAHGKLTVNGQVLRTERHKSPRQYLQDPPVQRLVRQEAVGAAELPFEFMLNALRLCEGFDQALFVARTGLAWRMVASAIEHACQRGLLEPWQSGGGWRPTLRGREMLNDLIGIFLPIGE
jgi:putative oxygen-independent coproporphyrinogen III oxidase